MNKVGVKIILFLFVLSNFVLNAQTPIDSLEGFNYKELEHHSASFKGTAIQKDLYIQSVKRNFIERKFKTGMYAPPVIANSNARGTNPSPQTNCTNIGFESGNTSNWTVTGANQIMSGAGTDPFGNFPVVYPGGGSYSLRLSDNNTSTSFFSSQATRVLNVTAGQTFFNLHFAMCILDYPHSQTDAARLIIQCFDASGNLLPCPQYECYYYVDALGNGQAVGVTNFQQTWGNPSSFPSTGPGVNLGSQNFPVTYANWQTVGMDLTSYVGQNITCVVTCKWCVYNYDWAYCYLDADCPASNNTQPNTCLSLPANLCGPTGMDTYSWTAPPGNSVPTATTSCINASVAGIYTVNCSVTSCNTTAYTYTYNVQPGPTASFTNTPAGCSGNISVTSTSSTNGGASITSYTWNWGDGSANGSGSTATHNYSGTGTNTVTLIISNGVCIDSVKVPVTIPPHPVPSFNVVNNCLNTASTFTSTSTASSGISSQVWEYGDGSANGSGAMPSHTYASAGTYTVTLIVTDNTSCVDSIKKPITINPLPNITASTGVICNGGSTTLNAGGGSTYTWSPATGLSSTTGASVTANPPSTTNYTITGTDANGCVNTNTTVVTVSNNPTVNVTTAAICVGQQTATLTATGSSTYAWSPATGLSATTGSVVTANPATTTVYTITGSVGTCTAVGTTTVTVNPLPVPTIGSNSPVCVNQTLNLNSGGGTSYSWSGPNSFSNAQQNPSITGITASAAGVYTVIVTDANSCVKSTTINVVINPLPIVTASGSTVCIGATINLNSTGGVAYSWSGPGPYSSNQQNPSITNASLNMSGNYAVTVTDANGCVSANVAQVTVNPSLVIIASSNSPICQNASLNLSASSGVSWSWSGPGGFASASQNPNITNAQPNISGTYTVVGTDANGCIGTNTTNVVINPLPNVTVSSGTICVTQQTTTLTANNASTYTWTPSSGLSSSNGNIVSANPLATTIYTVTGTDGNGCVNSAISTVLVNPLPNVTASSGTICVTQQTTTLNAANAVTFTWTPATGLNTTTGSSVIANPLVTTTYTVAGTDNKGCINAAISIVTVNPLPTVTVSSGTVCIGQQVATLSANGASIYGWSPPTGLSSTSGATVTANPTTTSTYTIVGTDLNGCINTAITVVTVNPLPVLSVVPPTSSGCAPVCVNFSNATTLVATPTYSWVFGDGSTSNAAAPSHCFTGKGTFYAVLTLKDGNGCVNSDTAVVIVYPMPHADFSFDPQPTTILNNVITFHDQSTNATITGWNWTFGDPLHGSSIIQNPTYTYLDPGTYPVQLVVTSNYGCKDSITKNVVINEDYVIYVPNAFSPNFDGTNDVFFAKGEGIKDFKMYIFDRWGNQIFYSDNIYKGWDGRYQAKGEEIVQEDVYVWKIEVKSFKGDSRTLAGHVSLLK